MNSILHNLSWQGKRVISGLKQLPQVRLSVLRKVFSLMGKRERNLFLALIAIAFLSFIFTAGNLIQHYTVAAPAQGGSYSEGIIGQPRFINPILASSTTDRAIVNLVYAGLYKFDGQGNVVPQLATDFPELTEEGAVYTVKLRDDLQWHNGLPVTADDVLFTIETIKNPEYNSPRRNDWLSTDIEVVDDKTIRFRLQSPSGVFLNNLTQPIVSRSVWGSTSPSDFILSQSNIEAVGNGPYKIKEVKKLMQGTIQSLTLESFKEFKDQAAYIKVVKLYFYDNGEDLLKALHGKQIDGFGFSQFETRVSVEQSDKGLVIKQIPLPQYQAAFLNTSNRTLGDSRVRQALNLATDPQQILKEVYDQQGILIDSPILKQHVADLPQTDASHNIDEAQKLLESAGWTFEDDSGVLKKRGTELSFTMATNDTPINVRTAEMLAAQWQAAGIKVSLNILPTRELTENVIRPRNYDILLFAQKLGADPDPFIFWHSSQTKHPGLNLSNYNNQAIDSFIAQARKAGDKATRDQIYLQMHELFKADLPAIFLVQTVYTYGLSDQIQGFDIQSLPDETARFYNLPNWYLDTKRVLK